MGVRDVKWIDGLRGLASIFVLVTHMCRSFDQALFSPADDEHAQPRLWQLPIFRVIPQGRIGVAIFAFMTGFVCALKPIRLSRAGSHQAAYTAVAKSAFRRAPRLVIPVTLATTIAFIVVQLGGFKMGKRCDSDWISRTCQTPKDTFYDAMSFYIYNIFTTWTKSRTDWEQHYDQHQWCLYPLLHSSLVVFLALVVTIHMRVGYRMIVCGFLYFYFWMSGDASFTMQSTLGMLCAEVANHQPAQTFIASHRWVRTVAPTILTIVGLYVASFPEINADWCAWSRNMIPISRWIFPNRDLPMDNEMHRYWTCVGFDLIVIAIMLSPATREVLASKYFMWFGKQSFAVYLIHGTLQRSLLVWFLYGIVPPSFKQEFGPNGEPLPPPPVHIKSKFSMIVGMPIWFAIVYFCAHLWTKYVDTWCANFTQKIEAYFFDEDEKSGGPLLST